MARDKDPGSDQPDTAQGSAPVSGGYVVLARKYRPQTFDDLIGQEAMVQTLRNAFAADRIAQGYMLTGVRGVGKTTTARILARALNYERPGHPDKPSIDMPELGVHCRDIMDSRHPDVVEMDAASNTGIDNIRELIESARYKPVVARTKVFIIDEVHMLSKGAFNALLKTLEEPPAHVKFIFATTEIRKVPVTVLSRCQRFDLRRVDVPVLSSHFKKIVAAEGAGADDEALAIIARTAEGSVRDGLSVLDQAIAMGSGHVTAEGVRAMLGLADRGRLFDLLDKLFAGHTAETIDGLNALHSAGADALQVLTDLAEAIHVTTRVKVAGVDGAGEGLSAEEKRRADALAAKLSLTVLSRAWSMLLKGIDEAGRAPNTLAAAEMVLIRMAHAADLPSPEDIIRTLGGGAPRRAGNAPSAPPAHDRDERAPLNRSDAPAVSRHETMRPAAPPSTTGDQRRIDEPPPPELSDYGAFDPMADFAPMDDTDGDDAQDGDEIASTPAPNQQIPNPQSFEDVLALVAQRRDAKLTVHLEEHVSLVKFDAAGSIEIHLLRGAPPELANDLREKLNKWTLRKWMVAISKSPGHLPVGEVRRQREAAEIEALKKHPTVATLLEQFPGAKIASVKPMKPSIDEAPDEDKAVG